MISLVKLKILTPFQKLPKNVQDLGKLIVAKALKSCQKSNESPNLVTLPACSKLYLECIFKTWTTFEARFLPEMSRRRSSHVIQFHVQNCINIFYYELVLFWEN